MTEPVSDARQKAFFDKARKGVLTWLAGRDGAAATLGDLHDYSAERYLVAHQGFSKMMESFVADALVGYDPATMRVTLSDAGRAFIAG